MKTKPTHLKKIMAATTPDGRLSQLARAASSVVGIGNTTMVISSLVRKRDLSLLWQLDPVAAPPPCIQKRLLLGTSIDEKGQVEVQKQRHPSHGSEYEGSDEARSVLQLQLQFAMRRHNVEHVRAISRELRCLEECQCKPDPMYARGSGELHVGDVCYALAKIVEWEWYRARLVNVRIRSPCLQIEYIATIEGDKSQLALPVPRVNYVPLEHVRLDEPEQSDAPVVLPTTPCVTISPA